MSKFKNLYTALLILLLLTGCVTQRDPFALPEPLVKQPTYAQPKGSMFDYEGVPGRYKYQDIINRSIYFAQIEPDPTLRPEFSYRAGTWISVCNSSHPFHAGRCYANLPRHRGYLPRNYLFPKTEDEIAQATKYFVKIASKNRTPSYGLSVPPEFNRDLELWLTVCHPSHSKFTENCHINVQREAALFRDVCVSGRMKYFRDQVKNHSNYSRFNPSRVARSLAALGIISILEEEGKKIYLERRVRKAESRCSSQFEQAYKNVKFRRSLVFLWMKGPGYDLGLF